ncbi:hypothetical protein MKD33_18365, partial [Chromobacterium piscinae]
MARAFGMEVWFAERKGA